MKLTRSQLRQLIKEAIEAHQVPVDLDTVDSEEAYGIGYIKGVEQDLITDDDVILNADLKEIFGLGRRSSTSLLDPELKGLEFIKDKAKDIRSFVKKIASTSEKVEDLLDHAFPNKGTPVPAKAVLGALKRFIRKDIVRPINVGLSFGPRIDTLSRIAEIIRRGQDPTALITLELADEVFDSSMTILTLGLGGIFGKVVSMAFGPLQDRFKSEIDHINGELDFTYDIFDWVREAEEELETGGNNVITTNTLSPELVAAVGRLKAPEEQPSAGKEFWADTEREDALSTPPEIGTISDIVAPTGTLRYRYKDRDTSSVKVTLLQKALAALGVGDGSEDGIFDKELQTVFKSWQSSAGLNPDGIYGNQSRDAMNLQLQQLTESINTSKGKTMSNKITEKQIREHIRTAIQEITSGKSATNKLTESKHLSEARTHIHGVINEIMVGLTPIKRIDTQGDAKTAMKGNNTNTAIDKAELGFNTFNMQEWASIAGIDEKDLSEALDDDTGNSSMLGGSDSRFDNVVDIGDPNTDSTDEIPGMVVSAVSGDSAWDDGLEDEVEDLADQLLADRETQGVESLYDFSRFLV